LQTLRVVADPDYRPMSFADASGKLIGYDVDFATELAAHLKIPLQYQGMAWDGIIPALQGHKIDAITSIVDSPKRREVVAFSQPVLAQIITTVVRADRPNFDPGKEDLAKLKVGVQVNSAAAAALEKIPGVNPASYNNAPDEFNDLLLGRIDVVAIESISGLYTIQNAYPGKLRVTGKTISDEPQLVAVAMRKDDADLIKATDAAINAMRGDGSLDNVAKKWFGSTDILAKP
jgi:ABC-type amino acid transport substrate-binding protein